MIREVGESIGRAILDGIGRAASRVQERKPLPADLLESGDAFLAVFDVPGATASEVQVLFEGNELRVHVDRFREFHDDFQMRFPGRGLRLTGEVQLPADAEVAADDADATLTENGTLEVLVPKTDPRGAFEGTEPAGPEEVPADGDGGEVGGDAGPDDPAPGPATGADEASADV